MRRAFLSVLAGGFLGLLSGCHWAGVCDCDIPGGCSCASCHPYHPYLHHLPNGEFAHGAVIQTGEQIPLPPTAMPGGLKNDAAPLPVAPAPKVLDKGL